MSNNNNNSNAADAEPQDTKAPFVKNITIDEIAKGLADLKRLDLSVITKPYTENNNPQLIKYIRKVRADTQSAKNLLSYYSYTTGKTVVNVIAPIASTTNTVVSTALGVSVISAVTVGVGTGGLALIVAGAVMTVGGVVQSAVSLSKTKNHIKNLNIIMNKHRMSKECNCHDLVSDYASLENKSQCLFIVDNVLPYIIKQKEKKITHRIMHVSVIGSPLESIRGLGRFAWKKYKGTQGKGRKSMAMCLTNQHLTTHCNVTNDIITQLLSSEESLGMRSLSKLQSNADTATVVSEIIFRKLGCT
ncbi:MAG: hypothetical protein ACI9ES_000229 [Oceanospirillaceae bacterium]|jgi:hypothetical protein